MGGRSESSGDYRYGFNGKEKDNNGEWGDQTHYDYGFRIYNPGIAKFLSVDPLTRKYPMLTPYQFAGNTPMQAIDLDGLEPISMITSKGKITKPMMTILNSAFGFSKTSLQKSTWVPYTDDRGKLWAKVVGIPQKTSASVSFETVVHDANPNRTDISWFGLIAHEQSHVQDIEDSPDFYHTYIIEGAVRSYREISTEEKAYEIGSDSRNSNDYADQLLRYKGGVVMNTLNNPSLNDTQKSTILESEGSKFKRDIILNDRINKLQPEVVKLQKEIVHLSSSKHKRILYAYMLTDLKNRLKNKKKELNDLKKEQKDITKKYGK